MQIPVSSGCTVKNVIRFSCAYSKKGVFVSLIYSMISSTWIVVVEIWVALGFCVSVTVPCVYVCLQLQSSCSGSRRFSGKSPGANINSPDFDSPDLEFIFYVVLVNTCSDFGFQLHPISQNTVNSLLHLIFESRFQLLVIFRQRHVDFESARFQSHLVCRGLVLVGAVLVL